MAKERLKSPRSRLFVALDLPEEVRDGLAGWQDDELGDPALRPVRPEALHMTLVFLGYQPDKAIDEIAAKALLDAPAPEIRLEPEPVGVPRGKHPRLFAIDAPSEGAAALQARISDSLAAAGFYEPEKRPYWPHLTVARVKPERRGSRRPARVKSCPGSLPSSIEHTFGSQLVLYRSHLRPQGAEYESLARRNLKRSS